MTSASRRRLRVTVVGSRAGFGEGLGGWLAKHAPARASGEVTIKLVSDPEMAVLNGTYRRKPVATDVLSFPAGDGSSLIARRGPTTASRYLGDIAIARGVAARQARSEGHSLSTELKILALHGLLHLLGYDHEQDSGEMLTLEERLRKRAGLPVALVARAGALRTKRKPAS